MCFVYILYSKFLNRFYVGHCCEDLDERLRKHLTNHGGFTSRANDWIILHHEIFEDKSSAYKRELEIKCWKSRKKIVELVGGLAG